MIPPVKHFHDQPKHLSQRAVKLPFRLPRSIHDDGIRAKGFTKLVAMKTSMGTPVILPFTIRNPFPSRNRNPLIQGIQENRHGKKDMKSHDKDAPVLKWCKI